MRVCEISHGGMGSVELVLRHEGAFRRFYARKRLHPQHRADPEFRGMFMDEARLAGLIHHPNVVGVVDVGEDADGPFIIIDYVDGLALAKVLAGLADKGVRLPLQISARVCVEVARGLHAAHQVLGTGGRFLGLVHRDVSPSNILLGFDGTVRVADFGIAKAAGNLMHTSAGLLKGNVGYLSPEQLRFEELDRRSDLFSLGVVLYELVAGGRLYAGEDASESARRILNEAPPDLGDARGGVPAALVELSFELLAKTRDRRPANAQAVAGRLEAIVAELIGGEGLLELNELMLTHFGDVAAQHRALRERQLERATGEGAAPTPVPVTKALPARRWARRWPMLAVAGAAAALAVFAVQYARVKAPPSPPSLNAAPILPSSLRGSARPVPGSVRNLWGGGWHNCALQGATLFCWGKNNEGQVGSGSTIDRPTREPLAKLQGVTSVALGFFHSCACTDDGRVHCWGRNKEGQLGTAAGPGALEPVAAPAVTDCAQIAAGAHHTCVVRRDGEVLCWGANLQGQVGQPAAESVAVPTRVARVADAVEVSAGGDFSCARTLKGAVLCWGSNSHGQLGRAQDDGSPAPVRGLDDALEMALGRRHACARRRGGALACWGDNDSGQLGTPPGGARWQPADVPGLRAVLQIVAGREHTCAIHDQGFLACFGGNGFGQLGTGKIGATAPPADALGVGGPYLSVAAGEVHTCARHLGGVACWGRNGNAQIGDGTTDDRARPVSVTGFRDLY